MNFATPHIFWWLALLPVLLILLVWGYRARRRALEQFAAQPLADRLVRSVRPAARRWKAVLLVAGLLCAVVALARPRWGFEWHQVKRKGVDVFVVLDVSKSMLAEDLRPNRLTQAKYAVEDLLAKLQGDRAGLIAFAGTAFVQCPLTVDYDAFRLTLREAGPDLIPRGGSAIGAAIRTALKSFAAGEGHDQAIVLITDGEQTDDDAAAAAAEAAKENVKIFAIGVGSMEGELIPIREAGKSMEFLKDNEGKVVKSRLDEATLKQLALATQGIYVRSAAGDFGMETVYEKGIAQLQRKEHEEQLQKRYFERFQWPLGLGLLLLAIEMFVSDRRRVAVLVVALFPGGGISHAAENWPKIYNDGVTAYRSNDLATAAAAFEKSQASPQRELQARALYNLGDTHYRLGEAAESQGPEQALPVFQKSLKNYEDALALDPQDADAKYNRDFVKKKIEELKKKQEEQKQQQQKQDQSKDQKQDQQKQDQQSQQKPQQSKQEQQQKQEDSRQDAKAQKGEQKPPEQQPQGQPQPAGNLDKQRAAAMLDNLKEDERNWNFFPEVQMPDLKDSGQPVKDW